MAARGRRSGFILIILALIIILGVVAAYFFLQQKAAPTQAQTVPTAAPAVETVDIVITTQNIPRGVQLTQDVLTTIPYPKKDLVEGMFYTNIDQVVGKRAVTEMMAQLPVTSSMIIDTANPLSAYPSFNIPANYTAVSIPISRLTSVSYGAQSGDHVMMVGCMLLLDIDSEFQSQTPNLVVPVNIPGQTGEGGPTTGTITVQKGEGSSPKGRAEMDTTLGLPVYVVPAEDQRPRLVCQTIIQDAVVLGVGEFKTPEEIMQSQQPQQPATDGQSPIAVQQAPQEPTPTPTKVVPQVITLVVSPQDAVTINYMLLAGVKMNLALRNPTDTTAFMTDAVTQQYLMDQKGIPLPAKLPYGISPRVDVLSFPGDAVQNAAVPQQ